MHFSCFLIHLNFISNSVQLHLHPTRLGMPSLSNLQSLDVEFFWGWFAFANAMVKGLVESPSLILTKNMRVTTMIHGKQWELLKELHCTCQFPKHEQYILHDVLGGNNVEKCECSCHRLKHYSICHEMMLCTTKIQRRVDESPLYWRAWSCW